MPELQVVATIPATPEGADTVRAALVELVAATRQEEGCVAYELFESGAAPGTFVTLERWRSQDDLDAHMQTPHIGKAFAAAEGNLAGEVAIHPLTPLA